MDSLSGKVAIITGAGRGVGCAEALGLAQHGVNIVINDIDSADAKESAYSTLEEIKALGGNAIVVLGDCADTADSERVFNAALSTFGDVNIMVNNAGFCRDKTLFSMNDDEFDSVVRVHLRGHFVNMRNAMRYWRGKIKKNEDVYGRLISTSSEASIFGSAGQGNYAAAKAGITAMTMGAAQLMIKYGVTCNVIMPRALTAMTDTGVTADMFKKPEHGFHTYSPDNISPLVTYLSSAHAENISGEVFVVWGDEIKILQRPRLGVSFKNAGNEKWSMENIHHSLSEYFTDDHKAVWDGYSVLPE